MIFSDYDMEGQVLTLGELLSAFRESVEDNFPGKLWVKAEIGSVKARTGSHCYLELLQTDGEAMVAKVRAVIWAAQYRIIGPYFEEVAGSPLAEGMEILVQARVNFSELYGLSLVIDDIDPEFTLGAKEDQRQKTLKRLSDEGMMDLQKELAVPRLPYRIAVVSAPDAAGYRDFMKHLTENQYGFVFCTELFPALMQGAGSAASVAAALGEIAASGVTYDLVAIMRGGGAKLDLACFDEYEMARAIALCPLPVVTGIGHDQDYHIADMVACQWVKTPTALADFLIDAYCREDEAIAYFGTRLKLAFRNKIALMESQLALLENRIRSADPRNVLSRGYTLTLDSAGVVRKSASCFRPGDTITILFPDGKLNCTVK